MSRPESDLSDCPKCEALYEVLRQVAFAPDLPLKLRVAYAEYRKVAPGCNHLKVARP